MKALLVSALFLSTTVFASGQRILFVAPHPDDEILGTAAQIWNAQNNLGGEVADYRIVIMTCGDAYVDAFNEWKASGKAQDLNGDGKIDYLDLGVARHSESLIALQKLGVPASKVIFLGYPDGGLSQVAASSKTPYESTTSHASSVPYSFAYHPGASYTHDSVIKDLKAIITTLNPDVVYSTTPTDQHPDHAQTREFVTEALAQAGGNRTHLEYLIHWEQKEEGWPLPSLSWTNPVGHIPADLKIPLSAVGMDRTLKLDAVLQYSTQVAVMKEYLVNFAKDSEVFWRTRPQLSDYLKK